jgi:hypothetical protein
VGAKNPARPAVNAARAKKLAKTFISLLLLAQHPPDETAREYRT